jgi:hypothetical protein
MDKTTPLLEWETLEYEQKKKSPDWYWAVGIIAVSMCVVSFLYKNILFGIFILIGTVTLMMLQIRKPKMLSVKVSKAGIRIDKYLYPYSSIKAFSIDDDERTLMIHSDRIFMPLITISTGDVSTNRLREILSNYLKEDDLKEPTMGKLVDKLGL